MKTKILLRAFSCFLILLLLLPSMVLFPSAANAGLQLDGTDVEEDLKEMIPKKYSSMVLDETQDFISIAHLQECGYDARRVDFSAYGLYLYIYNPSGKELDVNSASKESLSSRTRNL